MPESIECLKSHGDMYNNYVMCLWIKNIIILKLNRYIQLLKALIIFTPTDHSDKLNLIKFVEQLQQLNNEIKQV